MKISTKELRQLIRETIEETLKEGPISGMGGVGGITSPHKVGAAAPGGAGAKTDIMGTEKDKLTDPRFKAQAKALLARAKAGDPKAAASFVSMSTDSRDPEIQAMRSEYDKWQTEAAVRKMVGDMIKEHMAGKKKKPAAQEPEKAVPAKKVKK
jgi:hypothetical protein